MHFCSTHNKKTLKTLKSTNKANGSIGKDTIMRKYLNRHFYLFTPETIFTSCKQRGGAKEKRKLAVAIVFQKTSEYHVL